MLKKLIKIQSIGRFKSTAAQALARYTLILGANGSGKSTLCAVLRSLRSGEAGHIVGRKTLGSALEPSCEFWTETGNARFADGQWSRLFESISIFDATFIAESVHAGEAVELGQKRNLYRVIIGRAGIALAEEEANLSKAIREKTSEIQIAQRRVDAFVPDGLDVSRFCALEEEPECEERIVAQTTVVETVRAADAIRERALLAEISLPDLPSKVAEILGRSLAGVAHDAEQRISQHIGGHALRRGQAWLAEGAEYLSMAGATDCPFCGQEVGQLPLIAAYRAVFSAGYTELKEEIAGLAETVEVLLGDRALGSSAIRIESNRNGVEFWEPYLQLDTTELTVPQNLDSAARDLRLTTLALIRRKASAPLEPLDFDEDQVRALRTYQDAQSRAAQYNRAVRAANAQIAAKKALAGSIDLEAATLELRRLQAAQKRYEEMVVKAVTGYQSATARKEDLARQREIVREKLEAHTLRVVKPYEARINSLLDDFNAGFRITETTQVNPGGVAASSYSLLLEQIPVDIGDENTPLSRPSFKNTLSAGDKTTLALAFFLAHLERNPDPERIVVFDDPFSSQDAFRRQQTVYEIVKAAQSSGQTLVLSHDARFLAQLWRKSPADQRLACQILDYRREGSKLGPCDLESACRGRTASELDDLRSFYVTAAGKPLDIIKKMRIVLETFLRATYSGSFQPSDNLGTMVGKIRITGPEHPAWHDIEELTQLNDYGVEHHHGEDPTEGGEEFLDSAELKGYVRRTLKLVNNLQA